MEEAQPPPNPTWAPARYNPSNLVRNVNKADPDDKKFRLLKTLAIVFLCLSFVASLATSTAEILFICVEWIDECTIGSGDQLNRISVTIIVGADIVYTLFMAVVYIYTIVMYKKHHQYENLVYIYMALVNTNRFIILFIVWASAAAGKNLAIGGMCETFAIISLVFCPISIVIFITNVVILFFFRLRVVELKPDMLHGGGPDYVANVRFTGYVLPGQPPPPPREYQQPAYKEQDQPQPPQ